MGVAVEALVLHEALGDKVGMAADYGNLGTVHHMLNALDEAEALYRQALVLYEGMESPEAEKVRSRLNGLPPQRVASQAN